MSNFGRLKRGPCAVRPLYPFECILTMMIMIRMIKIK